MADALENRERGVQYTEKAGIPSGAPVQQELLGNEKPLLSDSDRAHDKPVYGGLGKDMEKSKIEQGAKAQEDTGIHEGDPIKRTQGRDS